MIHGFAKFHGRFCQRLGLGLDVFQVFTFESRLQGGESGFDRGLVVLGNLVAIVLQGLFGGMDQRFALVLGFHQFLPLLVLIGMGFSVLDHLVDVAVAEAAGGLDADLLFLAGALVLCGHVDDTVGVDVEGDLDLRNTTRCRRQADQVELTEDLVVRSHFTLTLEDADGHGRLIVFSGREHLALLGRDRRVAVDQTGEDTAKRFDAERQRGHVEQQNVLDVALQNTGLDRGTHGHDFVRVHTLVRLLAEEGLHGFLDLRHAGHAADQNHFVDFTGCETCVFQGGFHRLDGTLDQILDQRLELGAGEFQRQVLRTGSIRRDERQVDFGLGRGRQFDLRLFRSFLQTLQGQLVVLQVDALVLLELGRKVVDEDHVEVFTAEERVTVCGLHFEDAVADFQDGNVERATAKVVDRDGLAVVLVETVGKRCCRRLVDDTQDFETRDLAGILGGLTLCVVEVGRDGDDRLGHFFAEIALSGFFHLLKDESRHLGRGVFFAVGFHPCIAVVCLDDLERNKFLVLVDRRVGIPATDQALDREQGVGRVRDRLAFSRLADETLAIVGEGHHRRGGAGAFCVFNYFGILAVHDGDARVRRAEVDTNDLCHFCLSF
ncbi:putative NAD-specific glutamate dehydrogenase encoded in antisense gene pair with dnaKJ [Stappia aggregata IAM 12614]|uniref:Putative NAD-specific glutamate dehydrogenase encoded in antisense gene pair with dnaKJ n=1 Tax=Roseibium aggregatum (strain ATCC 25650 / DSM 13394 / JCM 20685 / NBRC 16684 / NCIMB 2208 / IAM 12614 / B1) TaxID=384765 RepID=A0NUH3_ROSAI|nr:putative NAD-specific glutamate dehydrogenase encoded in antisense gene pair with dnaKJ [Stappia aggregata IAM 12614] [Roseibium aggregatum IAM 12614]